MSFPGVSVPQSQAGQAAIAGAGAMGGASALLGPVGMGLSVASSMGLFNGGSGEADYSKAVSGGTFMTGDISTEKAGTTIVIIAALLLGLLIILKKGK